jgi:hypothetical protein
VPLVLTFDGGGGGGEILRSALTASSPVKGNSVETDLHGSAGSNLNCRNDAHRQASGIGELECGHLPLKDAKLGEPTEISFVGCDPRMPGRPALLAIVTLSCPISQCFPSLCLIKRQE